jgi:DNA-binding Xre family transcriptional regulator
MSVKSRIKVLLAERNLERARAGDRAISVRQLAERTGITHSALVKLVNNQSQMVAFDTLDKLMRFFGTRNLDDLLEYTPDEPPHE